MTTMGANVVRGFGMEMGGFVIGLMILGLVCGSRKGGETSTMGVRVAEGGRTSTTGVHVVRGVAGAGLSI